MEGQTKERWIELAELAAKEQDPNKLMVLIKQINDLLEAKEERLKAQRAPKLVDTSAPAE